MGASGSRSSNGQHKPVEAVPGQFVIIITAPPGVGKEELMGTFISDNVDRIAYVARIGAGLLYFYESASDVAVEPSLDNSYSTILQAMQAALQDGKSVVVDVDSTGARALRQANVPGVYVFLLPDSMDSVRRNIEGTLGGDTQETIDRAVAAAEKEIMAVDETDLYDYAVPNDSHTGALQQLGVVADEHGHVADEVLALESYQQYPRSPAPLPRLAEPPASPRLSIRSEKQRLRSPAAAPNGRHEGGAATASSDTSLTPGRAIALGSKADARQHEAGELPIPDGMERWDGAVAVVTGAASGVGWAVCEALSAAGMRVVAAAPRKDRLQALQEAVLARGAGGDTFLPVMCNVAREEEVRALFTIAAKTFPGKPVAVLVTAAAERPPAGGQLLDGSSKAWVEMMSTNVLAAGMCCREACASMQRGGHRGHIVLVGGPVGAPAGADTFYSATQWALKGLAAGLRVEAREAGLPLKVSLLTPGAVEEPAVESRGAVGSARAQLTPADVAGTLLSVLAQPRYVDVSEVTVRHVDEAA